MRAWILAAALASTGAAGCGDKLAIQSAAPANEQKRQAHADILDTMSGVWSGGTGEMMFIAPDGPDGVHVVVDSKLFPKVSARLKVVGFDAANKIISMSPAGAADSSSVWSLRLAEQGSGDAKTQYPLLIGQQGEMIPMQNLVRKLLPMDLQHMAGIEDELARKAIGITPLSNARCPGVDVSTTAGMLDCEDAALASAKATLGRAQNSAMAKATPERAAELQAAMREFMARLDTDCSAAKLESDDLGGSNLDLAIVGCKLKAVEQRTSELTSGQ